MLRSITLSDFLSYGPGPQTVELRPLNVLIGPNGSGKSNLIEALAVLAATPTDLPMPIRRGGGAREWLWRDRAGDAEAAHASLQVTFEAGVIHAQAEPVVYCLNFGLDGERFSVLDERIQNAVGSPTPFQFFGYENGAPVISTFDDRQVRRLKRSAVDPTQSILSQRRDPELYPEITNVGDHLGRVRIYRAWNFGPDSTIRRPCLADERGDYLKPDLSNLPARIAYLKRDPRFKRRLVESIRTVAPGFNDIEVDPYGGRLRLMLTEGQRNVSASRLSDGTLRFLCLAAILLSPSDSASLIAIEEPELGLHPDMFPAICELLTEASAHTQLIVTTHSTQLIDALTDQAGSVLVCEKPEGTTEVRRLDQPEIDRWRRFGSLGQLWTSGQIGGTRW